MKKKQFGILLTISLSKDMYEYVKLLSDESHISMGEVVRNSIDLCMNYDGDWMVSKRNINTGNKDKIPIDMSSYTELTDEIPDDADLDMSAEEEGQQSVY